MDIPVLGTRFDRRDLGTHFAMIIPAVSCPFSLQQILGSKIEEVDLRLSLKALWIIMASSGVTYYCA